LLQRVGFAAVTGREPVTDGANHIPADSSEARMETSIIIVIGAAFFTAVMTGAGALPFLLVKSLGARTMGWSNAAAAGLMLAASHGLIAEGAKLDIRLALLGVLAGLGAIMIAKRLLADRDDAEVADLQGASATKALLILGIMTAHSFAEGVGVGVSFAGSDGLGAFITTAIAFHNVPEGLAIALVLVPEAEATADSGSSATVVTLAFAAMMAFQLLVLSH
jgi:zinc transporter ZupT